MRDACEANFHITKLNLKSRTTNGSSRVVAVVSDKGDGRITARGRKFSEEI